jgi:hypothetical protein
MKNKLEIKTATDKEVRSLQNLSSERLIIWIIGKSRELKQKFSSEDIVIECWLINPEKHSMRGYPEYPDSQNVKKRMYEMKGKKGLLIGSEMGGFSLTDLSRGIYADIKELVRLEKIKNIPGHTAADRSISSIDEAPFKRLKKTPAYIKFQSKRIKEIVETDFLYFYGINWHSKTSFIHNRIKNIDAVVNNFGDRDETLKEVHRFLNTEFNYVKEKLLKQK